MTTEELLMKEEGFNPCAYKDSMGFWTIGYGTLIDQRRGGGITKEEALLLLENRIFLKTQEVSNALPWFKRLDDTRKAILVAMAFQLGTAGLMAFKGTLAAVQAKDYAKAAKCMRASLWAQQTPGRAERMAKAMETGAFE